MFQACPAWWRLPVRGLEVFAWPTLRVLRDRGGIGEAKRESAQPEVERGQETKPPAKKNWQDTPRPETAARGVCRSSSPLFG
jgi:hypothetical protein